MISILLVEDEALIRFLAEEELTELGYTVTAAASGDEAAELIGIGACFDLLVTDIRMPGMDGWTLARLAKSALPDLEVIYVTGFAGETHDPLEGMPVVRKPYRLEQLQEAIAGRFGEACR